MKKIALAVILSVSSFSALSQIDDKSFSDLFYQSCVEANEATEVNKNGCACFGDGMAQMVTDPSDRESFVKAFLDGDDVPEDFQNKVINEYGAKLKALVQKCEPK